MILRMCLIVTMIMPLCVCKSLECTHKNTSCNNIQTLSGFRFLYECATGTEVTAYYNQTVIAYAVPQKQNYNCLPEVISMDNYSIVTRECRDLRIQCILPDGNYVTETCEEFKITEKMNPAASDSITPWDLIIGVPFGVILIVGIIGMLYWCWKKKLDVRKQHGATVSGFLRYLQSCCCHRKGISLFRHHEGCEGQDVTTGDFETPQSDFSLVKIPSLNPRGSGENDMNGNEQDNTIGTVHVHSTDLKADDKTSQTLTLICHLGNQSIQPTKNGDISDHDDGRTFHHEVINSNLRDDPGGIYTVRTINMNNGCTHGDRGPEGHPLLLDQRAADQGSDMTGEAVALVNKHNFDPDQDNDAQSHRG